MAITDAELLLASGVSAAVNTFAASGINDVSAFTGGNEYDRGPLASGNTSIGGGLGEGEPLFFWVLVTTAFSGTSSTCNFYLCSDDTSGGFDASSAVHAETGFIPEASLTAGTMFVKPLAPRGYQLTSGVPRNWERYVGVALDVGAADITAGIFNAGIARDIGLVTQYASGLNFYS